MEGGGRVAAAGDGPPERRGAGRREPVSGVVAVPRALVSPPGVAFHLPVVVLVVLVLWAHSVPGVVFWFLPAWLGLLGLALIWAVRAASFLVRSLRPPEYIYRARWFLVAPVIGALTVGLVAIDAPLWARWIVSRPSFEGVVDDLDAARSQRADDGGGSVEAPGRIGAYRIRFVDEVEEGYIFYEANGAFLNDAGFAYLPEGPTADLAHGGFESPQFRHLHGPWYTWTASW